MNHSQATARRNSTSNMAVKAFAILFVILVVLPTGLCAGCSAASSLITTTAVVNSPMLNAEPVESSVRFTERENGLTIHYVLYVENLTDKPVVNRPKIVVLNDGEVVEVIDLEEDILEPGTYRKMMGSRQTVTRKPLAGPIELRRVGF